MNISGIRASCDVYDGANHCITLRPIRIRRIAVGMGSVWNEDCEVGSLRAGGAGFCEVDGAGGHSVLDGDGWMVMVEDGG